MGQNNSWLSVDSYSVGLDWATFSAGATDAEKKEFREFGHAYMRGFGETKNKPKKANVRDYAGYRISDTYFVERPSDGHMLLVASGAESEQLAEEVIKCDIPTHPTRLDIQATVRASEPSPDYPEYVRNSVLRAREAQGRKLRQTMAIFEHQTGFTGLCIGSRASEVYGRIYDWHAKHSGRFDHILWRHEIEYKGGAAKRLWQSYKVGNEPGKVIIATMADRLDKWAVPAQWLPQTDKLAIMQEHKVSDNERRLKYVDEVVAPMLSKLIAEGETDKLKEILAKHGLINLF